jgi:hypothetical protein
VPTQYRLEASPVWAFVEISARKSFLRQTRRQPTCRLTNKGESFANMRGVTPTRSVFDWCEEILSQTLQIDILETHLVPTTSTINALTATCVGKLLPTTLPATRRADILSCSNNLARIKRWPHVRKRCKIVRWKQSAMTANWSKRLMLKWSLVEDN